MGISGPAQGAVRAAVLALVASAAVLPSGAAPAAELDLKRTYYAVSGRDHDEIRASVKRNGPRGGFAYGIGFIDFLPGYRVRFENGECRVAEVRVGLRVALRLPKWEDPGGASKSAARFAAQFVRAVEAHEMQHVTIAQNFARRMEQRLKALKPDPTCGALREAASTLIEQIRKDHRAAQRAFDDRTRKQIRRLL